MLEPPQFLNTLIANNLRAMWFQVAFSCALLVLGLLAVATGLHLHTGTEEIKQIVAIGGGFISSLSALPLKEVLTRWEKVVTLRQMKFVRPRLSEQDQQRLDEITWKTIEKITAG